MIGFLPPTLFSCPILAFPFLSTDLKNAFFS